VKGGARVSRGAYDDRVRSRAMVEVRQYRGACVESAHPVTAVAVRDGEALWSVGTDRETAFRSACKPHQLAVSLAHLGDPSDLRPEHLAVGASSHSAEPAHLTLVREILGRFACEADALRCGAHPPAHVPSAEAILRAGGSFTHLHNNCSGKHAFMLAAASREGWARDYRPEDHPLQRHIRQRMAEWMAFEPATAIDGCGVPTFLQPVSRAARAWSVLAAAMMDPSPSDPWTRRLHRVGWAMSAHPELTSGTGRLDLDIVRHAREPLAVKIGAAGLFCVARPRDGTGLCVKVHSGSTDALAVAVAWALDRLDPHLFERPPRWELSLVRNVVGLEVGRWECA
jgi:L-asparaginase II